MRTAFIMAGGALLQTFHWIIYVFGGRLVLTGVKLLRQLDGHGHPERNLIVRLLARILQVSKDQYGARFVMREGFRRLVTPMFLTLVAVEVSDNRNPGCSQRERAQASFLRPRTRRDRGRARPM
jgi:tellurite resistance protein TerC